jgi:hypothetical protein
MDIGELDFLSAPGFHRFYTSLAFIRTITSPFSYPSMQCFTSFLSYFILSLSDV